MSSPPSSRNALPALHVVTSSQRRGAEVFAHDLVARLAARGRGGALVALTGAPAGGGLAIPVLGGSALAPTTLRALRRAAADVAIVVAHGSRTLPACALALAGSSTPFVYRSIGDPAAWSADGWRRRRTALLLRRARAVTALWPGAADTMHARHGVARAKLHVLPNGVDIARYPAAGAADRSAARRRLQLPAEVPIVGVVGALSVEKQVDHAVRSVAALPDVHLVVAGDGPERDRVAALAADLLGDRGHVLGPVDDVATVLAASDVVAVTSRTEGMPGLLIEAGLTARPTVAYDVGAVGEVIDAGVTGLLVTPGDVDGLVDALVTALADDGTMGRAGRARCTARFDLDVVAAGWDALLADLLGEAEPDRRDGPVG